MKYEVSVFKNGEWKAIAQFVESDYAQDFCGLWDAKMKIVDKETNNVVFEYDEEV